MGRPRKPEALRRLHGDRKDRFNVDEPVPLATEPVPPDDLSEAQRAMWDKVTGWLRSMRLLHAADTATIAAYCVLAVKLHGLTIRMTNEPEVVRNPRTGAPMENPVFREWLRCCTRLEALHGRLCLGFGSAARARAVEAVTTAPSTGADRLFNGA